MTNHECKFDWCESDFGGHSAVDNEHWSATHTVPATGSVEDTDTLPTICAQLWWNADIEAAPSLRLSFGENAGADLQLHEAVLLAEYLRHLINRAVVGTSLAPAQIIARRSQLGGAD